ncbi:alpha-ribazole phosphatase [Lacibacter luteus]|uniref:Alpha-ribazole phosphatase n=1 Tax=Lacibacter luteus TaxID=2508719 RepID=A0A4Q1CHC1_9BACT|nr:alpha-ribazole phosphatase [Lacibacter luteus]RXK59713.1 alpha-ribazole phosphatase [Lacibacter luteus]
MSTEIYLIRHTTPDVEKGTCYGQADLDVTESFLSEAARIKEHLPAHIQNVYSSPLQRCSKLAQHLFPSHSISFHDELKEINCGEWELKKWDDLPKEVVMPWMNDFVNVRIPGGESYLDLLARTTAIFEKIVAQKEHAAIVSHGGVLRSILSHLTNTALIESFNVFKLQYGCVVKLSLKDDQFIHEILHNIQSTSEQHKPSFK